MFAGVIALGLVLFSTGVSALPLNAELFCEHYPQTSLCSKGQASCQLCHVAPPERNAYGQDLARALALYPAYDKSPVALRSFLPLSLTAIEENDSDGDGRSNIAEINAGEAPGQADEPAPAADHYDIELAWRRVQLLFCGRSAALPPGGKIEASLLHEQLDRCLASEFWRNVALPRLADEKIRPNRAIGQEGDPFVLGDYRYDYRLFVYILTGGRDLRELLTARYHIDSEGRPVEGPIADQAIPGRIVIGNGQPLESARRYGMITTQWFIALNTMFAELPRNTASQAYRAYLGLDLARSEGFFPVAGEPRDLDHKGVGQEACAVCHSTLDPLAYAFAPYVGLRAGQLPVGSYDAGRTQWESWAYIFGEPVADLGAWAHRAVESEAFQKNITRLLFHYALGHAPASRQENIDFETLWRQLPERGYSADAILHAAVDTLSFAATRPSPAGARELIWKRARILERDLARALDLPLAGMCQELGQFSCFDQTHLFALGGNDPFAKGQFSPLAEPSQLSAFAIERVVLKACIARQEADEQAAAPLVFHAYAGSTPLGSVSDVELAAQTAELYRRFLQRPPRKAELEAWTALARDPRWTTTPARAWSQALCLGVGTQMEFIFF